MTDQSVEPLAWMREAAKEWLSDKRVGHRADCPACAKDVDMLAQILAKHAPASPQPATCPHGLILVKWACPICASSQPESAWISVDERLPPESIVLVSTIRDGERTTSLAFYCEEFGFDIRATHWQPLPAPPAEKGKKP